MTIDLNPDIQVRKDDQGRIRQLSHAQRQYHPVAADMLAAGVAAITGPRALAEQYLRDSAHLYDFAAEQTGNFAAAISAGPTDAGVELRFKEEKAVGSSVTVSYDQTLYGLPIWRAGMTVRVDGKQMGVTGSHNTAHYGVQARRPAADARYAPHRMHVDTVRQLLGLAGDAALTVSATRALIYQYRPADRLDSQLAAHDNPTPSTGVGGRHAFPQLPLPPVPAEIVADTHYVVTEVLFAYRVEGWGLLNWRAFVEPETGAVLYLRALVACARGRVFASTPVSAAGQVLGAGSPVAELDECATLIELTGLSPIDPQGRQELVGEYIKLVDLQVPATPFPAEKAPFAFEYQANTRNFAACSAYHHCDGVFRLIQGMGIDVASYFNNTDFPVQVDPHALDNEVNAQAPGNAMGNGLGRLVFGVAKQGTQFGIAADSRVVWHEFGHAVLWEHVDSPNFGFAHSPGDSLAAILHDPGRDNNLDRFETFPFMKVSADLSRRHDGDITQGWGWFGDEWDPQYGGEQVLSTTLFRVYQAAGGDSDDKAEQQFASRYVSYLILKGVGLLSFTTRDPDVYVAALTEADSTTDLFEGHPGGAFSKVFRWSFEQQGLYQPPGGDPTKPGAPPEVDVYIDDGRHGHYMPYLADHRGEAEIWSRTQQDGGTQPQTPAPGVKSFAYVRVRNRGLASATGVTVRGFQSRHAQAAVWPADWKPLGTSVLPLAAPIPPGGEAIVGPFPWTPANAGDSLMFMASAAGDRSNLEFVNAGPISNRRLVLLDNNIAERKF
ncbi:hypothetical protein [Variovorax guangxiensis]|uniref:hypothetical protein n=1 Tax=Variovorax guangxiensis TaxID=1775474 RepID=UPI00285EB764|nr:hypothetical protein [Variovorax guangxiensis]MDR6859875.1 hypothetical protein [Variovorax guangxiensis]